MYHPGYFKRTDDMTDMICNRKIDIPVWLALSFLALVLAAQTVLAAPQLYDVEVVIFTNNSPGAAGEDMNQPDSAAAPARGVLSASAITELPAGSYQLNNIRAALGSASGHRVLFHRAWRQPAYDRANAVDYPVYASAGNGRDTVSGIITLIKERYLHLGVDLQLKSGYGSNTAAPYTDGSGSAPAFRLAEKRRIRSGELHYFDHPRFGLIARVTPYAAPDEPVVPADSGEVTPGDAAGSEEQEPVPDDNQLTR